MLQPIGVAIAHDVQVDVVFQQRLQPGKHEREAFRAVFAFGGTLSTLDPANVSNLKAARVNAEAFAVEAMGMIGSERKAA